MSRKNWKIISCVVLLFSGAVCAVPTFAGSAVVGSVIGGIDASIGGHALIPYSTIFSGDALQVRDGVAMVQVGRASQMAFGRQTEAMLLRNAQEVTVLLEQGNISMHHSNDGLTVRVKAGGLTVTPATGFTTLFEMASLNGAVVVNTKQGLVRVEGNGTAVKVDQGHSITLAAKTSAPQKNATGTGAASVATRPILQGVAVGAGGLASAFAGVALSRLGDAKSAAYNATAAANNAVTTLNNVSQTMYQVDLELFHTGNTIFSILQAVNPGFVSQYYPCGPPTCPPGFACPANVVICPGG